MPFKVGRLRVWLAASGVLLLVCVAAFLAYGRFRAARLVRTLPRRLGADIQQTAEKFTYSQSEGGRTLFTIRASQMVQFQSGGRAELKDVNIIVYGRNSARFDQIYGAGFEYDPQQKTVRAKGEVQIDLEADAEGMQHADQSPPRELKNPVHVKTSGLEFNEKTGIAETAEPLEFRTPQGSGSALGAVYDSRNRILTLQHEVRIVSQATSLPIAAPGKTVRRKRPAEPMPSVVSAARATINSQAHTAVLEGATSTRGTQSLRARTVNIEFRNDSTVERVTASGDVQGAEAGTAPFSFGGDRLDLLFGTNSEVATASLSGSATFQGGGPRPFHGRAGKLLANFGPHNTMRTAKAVDDVDLVQEPAAGGARTAGGARMGGQELQRVEVRAPVLDLFTREGHSLDHAVTSGSSQVILTPAPSGGAEPRAITTITAPHFIAAFDDRNRLRNVHGEGETGAGVTVISRLAGGNASPGDRVTTSRTLDAVFAPQSNSITSLTQSGDFHYSEGQRSAWSDEAHFQAAPNLIVLSGSPRYRDEQVQMTADSLTLNRTSGEIRASGSVKATYIPQQTTAAGTDSMFSTSKPVHVTSAEMAGQRTTGIATFSGAARMWQDANLVEAPAIQFNRDQRSLKADGNAAQPAHSVFVESGANGRMVPVEVSSLRLAYAGNDSRARFSGGVAVNSGDSVLKADHVDAYLKPGRSQLQLAGQANPGTAGKEAISGPAQIERIIAQGNVTIVQPGRTAHGEQLVYVADNESFTLTGGPPSIFDAERGTITANSLTFFSHDDRVLVENPAKGGATRTIIHTRVAK
ncbi:MAG: LPS export ABC transporter periplasmic protein LptC [Acidobacteria bacterium]|nr:LPS export ABC transporter periplasmic protein LptC [Acidobacteriota bacterium]